jgi:hypothetical protein
MRSEFKVNAAVILGLGFLCWLFIPSHVRQVGAMKRVGNDDDDARHDPITGVSPCPAFTTGSGKLENKVLVLGPRLRH